MKIPTESERNKIVEDHKQFMDHEEGIAQEVVLPCQKALEILDLPILEIGTREGGSALTFLSLMNLMGKDNWLYTVDPYGSLPYSDDGGTRAVSVYDHKKYRTAMHKISEYAFENDLNHYHFKCTSKQFIDEHYSSFLVHEDSKSSNLTKFSFIFLDGNHDPSVVKEELKFALKHISPKGGIVVDDANKYAHEYIDMVTNHDYGRFEVHGTKGRLWFESTGDLIVEP